ncbi:MAG TPA: Ig-like domain-containing protein, partial [Verrucomicrobiae bacterium]
MKSSIVSIVNVTARSSRQQLRESIIGRLFSSRVAWIFAIVVCLQTGSAFAFNIGDHVETTATVNVRQTAAGTSLGTQNSGIIGTVTAGPTTATLSGTSYTWWDINFPSSPNGWVAGINLESAPPTVSTLSASSVTIASATLNSSVNPNSSSTTIYFQYGLTTGYGNTTTSGGIGTSSGNYGTSISGLSPNTTYHFRIVASNGTGTSFGSDLTFTTSVQSVPTVQTLSATLISASSATLNSSVNPNGANTTIYFQYGLTAGYGSTTLSGSIGTSSGNYGTSVAGLAPNTTYHFRIVASNSGGTSFGSDVTFTTSAQAPIAQTQAASLITGSSATLNSYVDPSGATTTIYFQYGLTASYGSTTISGNIGTTAGNYGTSISGLTANTVYHFRIIASDSGGTSTGNDLTFTTSATAPTAQTLAASLVTANSATLNSSVNPNGGSTTIYFQYGLTISYGSTTISGNIGTADGSYGTSISSLTANTVYHFRIVASNSGGTNYGSDMTFQTTGQAAPAVSGTLSTLTTTPSSAAADGQSVITAKVTLRNANNNPVSGKIIKIYSAGAVAISQSATPTDANGQATVTITATAPVSASIWAIDTSDSVLIQQQPTIQFTSAFVSPGTDLGNAIIQLTTGTGSILTGSIANIAADEGAYGDYFQGQATSDQAQKGVIAFSAGTGGLLALVPGKNVFTDVAQSLVTDGSFYVLGNALEAVAGNSTGLTKVGQAIANDNATFQQGIQQNEQSLLAGVPPASANLSSAFSNDLQLRLQANNALKEILLLQHNFLLNAELSSQNAHNNYDLLSPLFADVNVIGDVVGACLTGPGVVGLAEGLNAGESLISASINQNNLNANQQAYLTAITSLMNCSTYSGLIYSNTTSAFNAVAQGRTPNPVTGQILGVNSELTGSQYNLSGIWIGLDPTIPLAVGNQVTSSFSLVTIQNTSQQSATFSVFALYQHTINLNVLGLNAASMQSPIVVSAMTNLNAGQSAQLQLNYFDGVNGALPDAGSPILIYVLGYNGQNNQDIFNVGFASSTPQWVSSGGMTFSAKIKSNGQPLDDPSPTNTFNFENPIKCFVVQNLTNQTYQAQIWVANPFAIPLSATVTQPLPLGVTVLSTDGILGSSSIIWTNAIATNGLVEETFTFSLSTIPGALTNLPGATLLFNDATETNTLSVQSFAPSFNGLFPVQVNGFVPKGVSGADAPMQVTVTDLTSTSQAGVLNISLSDNNGNLATNISQVFYVNSLLGTNLNFILPGTLPLGSYLLTGSLNINGGSGQVLTGVYVVPLAPIVLGFGSATPLGTNGFNLVLLQAPLGSNYVCEFSSNLVNWTPFMVSTVTNLPFNFTDP